MKLNEEKLPVFQDFLRREERMQYIENSQKQANYECCRAIAKTLSEEFDIAVSACSVNGGIELNFRLGSVPYSPCFNSLLAELIMRCHQFCVRADQKDPSLVLLSLTIFTCDRILDGKRMMDY